MCAGYCSLVHFSEGDLGTPLAADKVPAHIQPLMKAAAKAAAPATPEQTAPAKASKKSQQETPGTTPKPRLAASCQGNGAMEAAHESHDQRPPAAAPAGSSGELDAPEQHPARGRTPGSRPTQADPAGAAQDQPSQASAPLPEPAQPEHPEQPPAQKRPMAETVPGQPALTEAGHAGSAVKKQKRIAPTAMASAFSGPSAARSGEYSRLISFRHS